MFDYMFDYDTGLRLKLSFLFSLLPGDGSNTRRSVKFGMDDGCLFWQHFLFSSSGHIFREWLHDSFSQGSQSQLAGYGVLESGNLLLVVWQSKDGAA